MLEVTERVDRLEGIVAELAHAQLRTEMSLHALVKETREFKDEVREFKNEMLGFKDEMLGFKNEMLGFKDEMREFKDGTERFRTDMELDRKRMNKAWGDLANRLGTVAEDIVAPNIPRIAEEEFGMGPHLDMMIRARRVSRCGERRTSEYDIVCAGGGKVIMVEVKSTPQKEHIAEIKKGMEELADFYPEYASCEKIGIFASWSLSEELCRHLSKAGLYGMAMGPETMDLVARP